MSTTNINVKAYLDQQGVQGETQIRRFDLDAEVSTSFEYLRSKLASIFPDLSGQGFRIYWKDEENDMIAISSDEELSQAMLYGRPTGLMKLFIRAENSGSTEFPRPQGGAEHPGVVCDGCNHGVKGLRFKCLVCPDYDLCSTCCETGVHNHHYMLRLATPASDWPGCGRRGGRAGWWWPGFGAPGFGAGAGAGAGFPGAMNMKRFWKNMMRGQRGDNSGAGPEGEPRCPGSAPSAARDAPETSDAGREQERDYLQHVGEQVSAMLEPFGVAVDVEVEERGPDGTKVKGRGGQGKWKCQGRRQGGNGRQCARGGKCRPSEDCKRSRACDGSEPQTSSGETDQSKVSTGEVSQSQTGLAAAAAEEPPMRVEPRNLIDEDIDMEGGEDASWIKIEDKPVSMQVVLEPTSEASPSAPPTGADDSLPQTIPGIKIYPSLTRSTEMGATSSHSSVGSSQSTAGGAAAFDPSKSDLDVKVAEAIEQMRSMGFHDDGGWMTAMLYKNGGDVHKVIDQVLRTAQSVRRE